MKTNLAMPVGLLLTVLNLGCQADQTANLDTPVSATTVAQVAADNTSKFCGGSGTRYSPFLICNANEFTKIDIGISPDLTKKYFKLNNDIDLAGLNAQASSGSLKALIQYFDGNLDGAGYSIKNYRFPNAASGALVIVNSGTISNLSFEHFNVRSTFPSAAFATLHYHGGVTRNLRIKNGTMQSASDAFQPAGVFVAQTIDSSIADIEASGVQLILTNHAGYTVSSGGTAGVLSGFNERATIENCIVSDSTITVTSAIPRWITGDAVGFNSTNEIVRSVSASVKRLPIALESWTSNLPIRDIAHVSSFAINRKESIHF